MDSDRATFNEPHTQPNPTRHMTLLLLIGGLALFALCFRAIDWFEKI